VIPIKALEFKCDSILRAGLRQSLRGADPRDITTSLREAGDRLTISLYVPLYAQIQKTYREGYISGGNLIMRHAPRGTMLTAAAPLPAEDPRIAKATRDVIYGLKDSLGNHKNEIQATMRAGFEQGESIPKLSRRLNRYFDNNRAATTRMARTTTNDVFNRAHIDRYEDSGVVEGVQYSAHIDDRTSDICEMMNGTIYGLGDRDIQVPPLHFNCLVAGTQVLTITGMQDIESLQINDVVLTHRNRYMPVTDVMNRVPDALIEIKTANRSIRVTPNHPILVQRDGGSEWVAAGDLKEGDSVVVAD